MSNKNRLVVRDSENFWQLEGESEIYALTVPDPPEAGEATVVRLTLSNTLGPVDDVELFVRIGDPKKPTKPDDLDSADDWVETELVEELVFVDDEEILRSQAEEPFEDETPWDGTYQAELKIPKGRHSIEIKVVSHYPEILNSGVLTGWDVNVE